MQCQHLSGKRDIVCGFTLDDAVFQFLILLQEGYDTCHGSACPSSRCDRAFGSNDPGKARHLHRHDATYRLGPLVVRSSCCITGRHRVRLMSGALCQDTSLPERDYGGLPSQGSYALQPPRCSPLQSTHDSPRPFVVHPRSVNETIEEHVLREQRVLNPNYLRTVGCQLGTRCTNLRHVVDRSPQSRS